MAKASIKCPACDHTVQAHDQLLDHIIIEHPHLIEAQHSWTGGADETRVVYRCICGLVAPEFKMIHHVGEKDLDIHFAKHVLKGNLAQRGGLISDLHAAKKAMSSRLVNNNITAAQIKAAMSKLKPSKSVTRK